MLFSRIVIILLCFLTISSLDALQLDTSRRGAIAPYLIKESHPIKSRLDEFFSKSRVTHSLETLQAAGFENVRLRWNNLVVTSHPNFPGYIFKLYIDEQPSFKNKPEENLWISRIKGAKKIRNAITKLRLDAQFKVPKKWIYELPEFPEPLPGLYPKFTLLVSENMEILPTKEYRAAWASEELSTDLLLDFLAIINKVGLEDLKPENQPFCKDGRIAFVDTSSFDTIPHYSNFTRFLSPWNQVYWKKITKQ